MSRHLPAAPSLEYLRKQAKELLRERQRQRPGAKLADAQQQSGRKERNVNTLCADGQERVSEHGYVVVARWRGRHVLETTVTKAGRHVGKVTCEMAEGGHRLVIAASSAAHDGYPAVEDVTVFRRLGAARVT